MNKLSIQKLLMNYATHYRCDFSLSNHHECIIYTAKFIHSESSYQFNSGDDEYTLHSTSSLPTQDLELIAIACQHLLDVPDQSANIDYYLLKLVQQTIQHDELAYISKYISTDQQPLCFAMITFCGDVQSLLETIRNSFEDHILVTPFKDKVLLLFSSNESHNELCQNLYHTITSELLMKIHLYYVSPSSLSISDISLQTLLTIEQLAQITCPNRSVVSPSDLGIANVLTLLEQDSASQLLTNFNTGHYDELDNEEDIKTIYAFFENNLNIAETSRQLFIHRNTLVYRLDKYQKVTNLDIRRFEDATKFQLSFFIYHYYKK